MPHRNLSYEAIVLRSRESPGGARIVTLLAAEEGLVDAFVFGGPKSRLKSLASPYHAGTAWVYRDPVKDLRKLSDFDARRTFPTLRENLRKLWAASFLAETLLRTDAAGGESRSAYGLLLEGLGALDAAEEPGVDYVSLQYGWRLLDLMGLRPDPEGCSYCGAALPSPDGAFFSWGRSTFLCPACLRARAESADRGAAPVSGGVLRYLARSGKIPFRDALRAAVSEEDLSILKAVVFHLVRGAAEGELRTLARGEFL